MNTVLFLIFLASAPQFLCAVFEKLYIHNVKKEIQSWTKRVQFPKKSATWWGKNSIRPETTINMYVAKIGLKLLSRAVKYSTQLNKGRDVNDENRPLCQPHKNRQIPDYNSSVDEWEKKWERNMSKYVVTTATKREILRLKRRQSLS